MADSEHAARHSMGEAAFDKMHDAYVSGPAKGSNIGRDVAAPVAPVEKPVAVIKITQKAGKRK